MKVRNGFVSNSSSASFIIKKEKLTSKQIEKIINHIEEGLKIGMYEYPEWYYNQECIKKMYPTEESKRQAALESYKNDAWYITETDTEIKGYTSMDNFGMYDFLIKIGVIDKDIDMEHD